MLIAALVKQSLHFMRHSGLETLVICPLMFLARVKPKFEETAEKLKHHLVKVVSYEAVPNLYKDLKNFRCIIIDECHRLKTRSKIRTDRIVRLALKCELPLSNVCHTLAT